MDYEDKYKSALERAKIELNADTTQGTKNVLMTVFPELKESEDEKIRKGIIELVKQSSEILNKQNQNNMIAWLEKQGKKKTTNNVEPKFKVGDIVKFDRPSAMLKREILNIDFENERYLTRRTDIGGAIKEFIYFCEQDDYVIVGSHNNLSIEVKVSILADEIIALKQRVKALEIQVIKDMSTPPLTQVYSCPDRAGDNVTLENMKS